MKIYGYGEDALTLWAMKNKLEYILDKLHDHSNAENCIVFYRPSFGRGGGENSSQFGEFDFIILAEKVLYLGESKWDGSPVKINDGLIVLEENQLRRHLIFRKYIELWQEGNYTNWHDFAEANKGIIEIGEVLKPIPGEKTKLAKGLKVILPKIKEKFYYKENIINVLLYFYNPDNGPRLLKMNYKKWEFVLMNYSKTLLII